MESEESKELVYKIKERRVMLSVLYALFSFAFISSTIIFIYEIKVVNELQRFKKELMIQVLIETITFIFLLIIFELFTFMDLSKHEIER